MVAIVHGTCSNSWRTIWLLSTRDNISSCLIQGHAWHWVRKAAKRRSSSAKAGWSESTSESTLNHKPSPCPTWTGHNKSKRKDIPAKVQLSHDMFAVGSFEVFLPKLSYLLFIYLPSVMSADRKLGSHACVPIRHAWWKSLSHYSINWHILKKHINYLNKPEPKREKKSLCGWSTFSEFSFFSREVNVPLCSCVRVRQNSP